MPKRLTVYAPVASSQDIDVFAKPISAALEHITETWDVTVVARALDDGSPWLNSRVIPLEAREATRTNGTYPHEARVADFRQLVGQGCPPFDVLFLPSPWGSLPLGLIDPVPAPVVISIHYLGFEQSDDEALNDQRRLEARYLAKLASAVVFPSDSLRERAIRLYEIPRERTYVVSFPELHEQGNPDYDVTAREYLTVFEAVSSTPWKTRARQRDVTMVSREERVAWLHNHTGLHDAEVPLLRAFGLEVYTSKYLPQDHDPALWSVCHADDTYSTLPNWVLERLNRHNFYEDGVPSDISELLNGYFGTVIITSDYPLVRDTVRNFTGRILVRLLGREAPQTYSTYFSQTPADEFWRQAWSIQDRLWFVPPFDAITSAEESLLRQRSLTLPIVLPDRMLRGSRQWRGDDKRILFLCPRISSLENISHCYQDFRTHVGHLPHLIAANQAVSADDPNVPISGSPSDSQQWFRDLRVMFYASREPRYMDTDVLDAMAYGMPVIFMADGLIGTLIGKGRPGACSSYSEVADKLQRILSDDADLIESIIESQTTLLVQFRPETAHEVWKERFLGIVMNTPVIPDVRPFTRWVSTETDHAAPPAVVERKTDRKIGIYALMVRGGGIYKYVAGLAQAASRLTEASGWVLDLMWGLPTIDHDSEISPTWDYEKPEGLRIITLPTRISLLQMLRRQDIDSWRRSYTYLTNRPIRILSEMVIIPVQYVAQAIRQRTLRPQQTQLHTVLIQSRLGRRLLQNPIIQKILPSADELREHQGRDVDYLVRPPPKPGAMLLLEPPSPPIRPFLTLDQIREMCQRYDVLLFGNPFRLISPNTEAQRIAQQPVVITMYDLAHEFTEVWGTMAASISREMALWGRLAQAVVFGSEYIRDEAVKLYGIPFHKTHIVRPPPLVVRRDQPGADEVARVKARLNLPERYIFNTGFQGTHKNNITIFAALQILRWRGFPTPPFVIGGVEARRLLTERSTHVYLSAVQQIIHDSGFVVGNDLIITDYVEEVDLPAVYAGASVGISMSRSESTVHGMILESMLYGLPIIASTIPQNVEQLGLNDDYALLVPADDPVALADAIEYTLLHPEETAARVKRARAFIEVRTLETMAEEFLTIFDEVIASRRDRN